jgi:hypothetical protein
MRKAISMLAVAIVAAVLVSGSLAASPPSLRLKACVNDASPPQFVITQTWRNAGPADFGGFYVIVYDFISSLGPPLVADTIPLNYLANPGGLASGSQFDTFNSFLGPTGFVPWNNYIRVDVTYNVNLTTTVSSTLLQPKMGWRSCR